MSDVEVYKEGSQKYEELQEKRPDYVHARQAFIELAQLHFANKTNLIIVDFCCGTGNNTKLIAQKLSIQKATLIDINETFLDTAVQSGIRVSELVPMHADILDIQLKSEHDLVVSMFAYHHVPDDKKEKYIEIVKDALKIGGILLLGEIYSPNKETTLKYYTHLLDSIDPRVRTQELERFLIQTAESDDFEYKVSRLFAKEQLQKAGFQLLDSRKIWPTDGLFNDDVGTFVEVWQLNG